MVKKLTLSGVFIALSLSLSAFYIPLGGAKVYPIQHLVNVLSACLLGPFYGVTQAFVVALLRNLMGLGTVLAFPGSMIGAFLAAWIYKYSKSFKLAALFEWLGTGWIGALLAAPIATWMMGLSVTPWFFVVPFAFSSGLGGLLAVLVLEGSLTIRKLVKKTVQQ